ncbi:hypothetical protein D3C80_2117260 [compost metagenome]
MLADLTGQPVWTCELAEAAAAGAAVQAAAALTGRDAADLARDWTPTYKRVAEPDVEAFSRAEEVRSNYRKARGLA